MKNFVCSFILFLFVYLLSLFNLPLLSYLSPFPLQAKVITGEVKYNAANTREEVFSNPLKPFNINSVSKYYIDKNNIENLNALHQGITELKDRKIAKFSDGSYGIQYYDDPMYSWYYSEGGRLINFTQKDSTEYPCKIVKYKPDGQIANVGYRVSERESFIYSSDGKLIAHWLGENCYDEFNKIIMKRKFYN